MGQTKYNYIDTSKRNVKRRRDVSHCALYKIWSESIDSTEIDIQKREFNKMKQSNQIQTLTNVLTAIMAISGWDFA